MDKKTILGIVVVAVLFLGFAYVNTKQQEKYQQEMAAWQAYQDSVAAASRPAVPAADSVAGGAAESAVAASGETRSGGGFGPDRASASDRRDGRVSDRGAGGRA